VLTTPIVESINEQAARWVARADAGVLNPSEQRQLELWLDADPRHRGAYVRAQAQWLDLDRLAALHGPTTSSDNNSLTAAPTSSGPALQQPNSSRSRFISRRQLLAAGVAGFTAIGGGLSWIVLRQGRERYTSGIGEIRRITLTDGSTTLLNTDTEISVHLTPKRRDVHLLRGEAFFEVAHDKARPFVVHANDTLVRAIGTTFAVKLESTQVDVTVTEGVVEVANRTLNSPTDPTASPASHTDVMRVAANEQVVVTDSRSQEVRRIAPTEADRQLAWREGMVSFDGEPLQTAVNEINRHNQRKIVIDDPALATRPVVGIFRATDLDGFSAAAAEALKARVVSEGDVIHLQSVAGDLHQ
jgi:transmembrane sensor